MDDKTLLDIVASTLDSDERVNTQSVAKSDDSNLTFKRDENGILWSYDEAGKKVGRIYEHGDDSKLDTIKEI